MKKLIIAALTICSFAVKAQKNTLLEQSFWRNQPSVEVVKAEVEKGNNPFEFNRMTMDAVVIAINSGAPNETIKYLLNQPKLEVNRSTHEERTYLHWAANRGNFEIMEALVEKGAKANIKDENGVTPLAFAAMAGQLNVQGIELFVKAGANLKNDLNNDGANILLLAVANDKDLVLTNYFISKGLDIKSKDKNGNNIFSYAARGGNINILKALIQKGVAVPENALLMAAQGGRRGAGATLEVFEYLESLGLKPTATTKSAENVLHFIVRKPNQKDIIEHFLAKGVNVNQADEEGNTVFAYAAASNRDLATLELLLAKTTNINQANQKGETPLALAVKSNSPEVVKFLLDKGADVKAVNTNGENLLAYLVQAYPSSEGRGGFGPKPEDFDAKLKVLQEKGLSVATPQKNGNTLFHLAVLKNDLGILKRVQALGIDVNAKNAEGITALHKAAMIAKDDNILKYLLSIGAKKEAETNFKETAFDLASENETLAKNKISINFLK
ncbi:ankyrin repeat domain-containing protein [Arcicella rigui]|uniref:Ankyrin repeat domain-containing protein n=1 Tax=Arcicella rigui TaxID=797020 RepID=A0ABU5QDQ5_9BACT|nr:ankyrin repeat domain-containing protein [Arcicella rigui]MEA5140976.1 ankyrin repeat domain-containing protein [Arcicella rigui]